MLGPCGSCPYFTAAWPWFRERWMTAYNAGGKQALLAVLLVGTGGHGSMRTPGLRMPFGSSRFFTARIDSANSSGR